MFSGFKALIQFCCRLGDGILSRATTCAVERRAEPSWVAQRLWSLLSEPTHVHWVTNIPLQHIWSSSLVHFYWFMEELLCEPLPCWAQLSPGVFDSRAGMTRAPAVFPSHCQLWNCCACAEPLTEAQLSPPHQDMDWAPVGWQRLSQLIPIADRIPPNHRIRGWGPEGHLGIDQPSPSAESRVSKGWTQILNSGTAPDDFWMSPRMGTPPPVWAAQSPSHKSLSWCSGWNSQVCPCGLCPWSSLWAPLTETWLLSSLVLLPLRYFHTWMAFPQTFSSPDQAAPALCQELFSPALSFCSPSPAGGCVQITNRMRLLGMHLEPSASVSFLRLMGAHLCW